MNLVDLYLFVDFDARNLKNLIFSFINNFLFNQNHRYKAFITIHNFCFHYNSFLALNFLKYFIWINFLPCVMLNLNIDSLSILNYQLGRLRFETWRIVGVLCAFFIIYFLFWDEKVSEKFLLGERDLFPFIFTEKKSSQENLWSNI